MTSPLITGLTTVNPGDLITAAYARNVVAALKELDARLSLLETGGQGSGGASGGTTQPVREFRIDSAILRGSATARVAKTISIMVSGIGLDPGDLRSFALNDEEFEPRAIKGEGSRISIALMTSDVPVLRRGFDLQTPRIRLSITNRDGETASADVETEL